MPTEPGFEVDGLSRMRMQLPPSKYPTPDARRRFFEQLLPRVEAIPGVQSAAITTACRRSTTRSGGSSIDGRRHVEDERRPLVGTVSDHRRSYFDVLGVGHDSRPRHRVDRRRARRRERRDQPDDGGSFLPRRGSDRPAAQVRSAPATSLDDAARSRGARSSASARRSCRDRRTMRFASPVVYLPLRQSAPRTASVRDSQRAAAGERDGGRPRRGAVDRRRSAGLHDRDDRGRARERAVIYRIFATLFGMLARRSAWCCRRSASTA